jgi:hypothetical protein
MSRDVTLQFGPYVECKKAPGLPDAEFADQVLEDRINSRRLRRASGGEAEPEFVPEGYDVWFSNSRNLQGDASREIQEDEDLLVDLTAVSFAEQMQSFSETFAPEIEVLYSFYGPENVRIRWGIVHYTH